jgi:hypothetical protein
VTAKPSVLSLLDIVCFTLLTKQRCLINVEDLINAGYIGEAAFACLPSCRASIIEKLHKGK